jgi:hypothetical protein
MERLTEVGVSVVADGQDLVLRPREAVPPDLVPWLRRYKADILRHVKAQGKRAPAGSSRGSAKPQSVKAGTSQSSNQDMTPELERLIALGSLLTEGTIKAIKCGITGKKCTACQGVPCMGSLPWENS